MEGESSMNGTDEIIIIDSFYGYYTVIMECLGKESKVAAETVAPLLSLQHEHIKCAFLQLEDANESLPNRPFIQSIFDDIILMHLSAAYYLSKKQHQKAYNLQLLIYLPLLGVFCSDLRLLAKKVDEYDHEIGNKESCLEDVANLIIGIYRICVADSRLDLDSSLKVAIIPLTVELFKIYFDMNKMALLKPLIRSVENLNCTFIDLLSLSDLIAYNYFLGKKAIFDGDMQIANKALEHAFQHCSERFWISRRNILIYWLPVKMFLGFIPTPELLKEYDLQEFLPIVEGVNNGDLRQFRQGIISNRRFLMESGVYLMFEKLTQLTYLALFKRLVSIIKKPHIRLEIFMHLLKFLGEDIRHIDEVVCAVSNLIAKKKIRGYISKTCNTVVLSKVSPFDD